MARVALVYHPEVEEARALAQQCARVVDARGLEPIQLAAFQPTSEGPCPGDQLVVTFGGDGTILWVARWLDGAEVPILGVQMGRLGFLAELSPTEVVDKLGGYLDGDYWLDRRAMLRAAVMPSTGSSVREENASAADISPVASFTALNDVVVGGGYPRRTVSVELAVDGHHAHEFRCDGVIAATATGSTAYSFASGGPVLAPDSQDLAITPISPHLSALRALVLPAHASVQLRVRSPRPAELTVDGQVDHVLRAGEVVDVSLNASATLFARRGGLADLYRHVLARLG